MTSAVDVSDKEEPEKEKSPYIPVPDGHEGPNPDPCGDYSMETPFDCFKRPDVIEQLRNHPTTRPYSLDSGFLAQVERMKNAKTQQEQGSVCMADPRLMQAMAALQNWGLTVTEKEQKHAEQVTSHITSTRLASTSNLLLPRLLTSGGRRAEA